MVVLLLLAHRAAIAESQTLVHVDASIGMRSAQLQARQLLASTPADRSIRVVLAPGHYFNTSLSFSEVDSHTTWHGNNSFVYGGPRITGWTRSSQANVWMAHLPEELVDSKGRATFHKLVEGERSAWLARSPNFGGGYLQTEKSSNSGFTWGEGALPAAFDCIKSSCSVFTRAGYSSDIRQVLSVTLASRSLTFTSNHTDNSRGSFYLQGAVELLDSPGEWAVRNGNVYYWPHASDVPINSLIITAPTNQRVFSFVGSSRDTPVRDITLDGLRIVGSDMPAFYTYACKGDNPGASPAGAACKANGGPSSTDETNTSPRTSSQGMVYTENATRITIQNCSLKAAGIAAFWLQEASSHVHVLNNWVEDVGGFGLYANGIGPNDTRVASANEADVNHNHLVSNNIFYSGGHEIMYGSGVWFYQSGNNTITHNVINGFPRDCIGFYGVLPFWTADPSGPVAPGMPPALRRKYWGKYLSYNGQQGTVGTKSILNVRNTYVAYNDCSSCNRQGLDGGVVESWGTGDNNTWEYNALHDNEGYAGLSLFFADDFSPGTNIRKNLAFENNCPLKYGANCAVFMIKSSNLTVAHNTVADSNYSRVFEVAHYRMPASNMAVVGNLLFNTTQRRLVTEFQVGTKLVSCQGGAATLEGAFTKCDSYYTTNACARNVFGPGLCYHNSTLRQLLAYGDGTNQQRSRMNQYGFDAAQLVEPVVAMADAQFVDEPRLLHVGTCDHFDTTNTVTVKGRPFKEQGTDWYRRTHLDYGIALDSPLRQGVNGFKGLSPADLRLIGIDRVRFPFDLTEYKRRDARYRLQAENYDRTKGLWTMQAKGIGTTPTHFESVEPKDLTAPGSWARYDNIDFTHMQTFHVNVQMRALAMAGGATVLFLLGSPEVPANWQSSSRLLSSVQVPSVDEGFDSAPPSSSSSFSEWPLLNGTAGPAVAPDGTASVFMVFTHTLAAPTPVPTPPYEDDKPHRYWRITTRPDDFNTSLGGRGLWDVCELALYANYSDATAGAASAAKSQGQGNTMCTDRTKAICSSDTASTRARNAFDGIANCTQHDGCSGCKGSMWRSASNDRTREWLGYDFGAAAAQTTVVRAVRLKQFPNQYCSARISLQSSDDNVSWQTKWGVNCVDACPNDATASESLGWTLSSLQAGKNVAPAIPGGGEPGIGAVVDWFRFGASA
jgi:hypothetical protein